MNPFTWIRTAARNAFLGGIQDAVEQVAADGQAITLKVELPALAAPPTGEDQPAEPRRRRSPS